MTKEAKEKLSGFSKLAGEIYKQVVRLSVIGIITMVTVLFADHNQIKDNTDNIESLDNQITEIKNTQDSLKEESQRLNKILSRKVVIDSMNDLHLKNQMQEIKTLIRVLSEKERNLILQNRRLNHSP